jgi:hypothetical protein
MDLLSRLVVGHVARTPPRARRAAHPTSLALGGASGSRACRRSTGRSAWQVLPLRPPVCDTGALLPELHAVTDNMVKQAFVGFRALDSNQA